MELRTMSAVISFGIMKSIRLTNTPSLELGQQRQIIKSS